MEPQSSPNTDPLPLHKEDVQLQSLRSLERLRDRVETASLELKRLRQENRIMAERIRALEENMGAPSEGTTISFDESPELLQRKISNFIEALDQYLEKDNSQE